MFFDYYENNFAFEVQLHTLELVFAQPLAKTRNFTIGVLKNEIFFPSFFALVVLNLRALISIIIQNCS